MSSHARRDDESQSPQATINRVLEAERRMADTLDECRKRAGEIVEKARRRVRTIANRTDRRVILLHQRCDEASEAKTRAIESSFDPAAGSNRIDPADNATLQTAVEQLAKSLTTAERDGPTK